MTVEIEEIIQAIHNIEADIFEQTNGRLEGSIKVETTPHRQRVYFLNLCIWDSENGGRRYKNLEYNEEERETIEQCLRREIRQHIEKLSKIAV